MKTLAFTHTTGHFFLSLKTFQVFKTWKVYHRAKMSGSMVFTSISLLAAVLLAGCQLEKIDSVVPATTFDNLINADFKCTDASICEQIDGNFRVVCNQVDYFLGKESYSPVVMVLDEKGSLTWKKEINYYNYRAGAIYPNKEGGYFIPYGRSNRLGFFDMNSNGDVTSIESGSIFSIIDENRAYLPHLIIPKFQVDGELIVCGNTDNNDDTHIAFFERRPPSYQFEYQGLVELPFTQVRFALRDPDDGLLICGFSSHLEEGMRVAKRSGWGASGIWNQVNYSVEKSQGLCSAKTADKGYLIIGSSYTKGNFMMKVDSLGREQWVNFPIFSQGQVPIFLLASQDGNYLLCGSKNEQAYAAKIKVDNAGPTIIWEKNYAKGTNLERAIEVEKGFLMIGSSRPKGIQVVKTDQNGNVY